MSRAQLAAEAELVTKWHRNVGVNSESVVCFRDVSPRDRMNFPVT